SVRLSGQNRDACVTVGSRLLVRAGSQRQDDGDDGRGEDVYTLAQSAHEESLGWGGRVQSWHQDASSRHSATAPTSGLRFSEVVFQFLEGGTATSDLLRLRLLVERGVVANGLYGVTGAILLEHPFAAQIGPGPTRAALHEVEGHAVLARDPDGVSTVGLGE